ncbi:hypothetical protein CVT24_008413 [Panaeolus cyanescens]|uniref:Vacuolar protein sorting-associated protein n=1 Tax=Panaeolus cyanescens TaxID=181874 RepID=A0A409VDS0_9AGAR|nr:hypothetical protein CVT24_008413 [Panaeolus cyanescens]
MWWLDPGKEVLNVLFNRILAPYVMNLDLNQVNYGIGQGRLTLRNLKLKKGALDKFQLPVDVLEGHLGKFTLSLHWMNLGNQPVEILVEDVYLLVVPSPQYSTNAEEDEARAQSAKAERLENAELLHVKGQAETQEDSTQTQGLIQSLITKVINNVQITVKNVHIRYEDNMSVPGHPFAAGITLAGFTAESVNNEWRPAFIESTAGAIHKLARLESLALYFDTDSPSMAGMPTAESILKFASMISHKDDDGQHQYILKPVSGEGRIVVNHKVDKQTPRFDVQLIFEEIGIALDDHQYRDVISLVDMYHVFIRKRQYGKYRPTEDVYAINPARARLLHATGAILEGVREKKRKWTWEYFAERRDDRNKYVEIFQKKTIGTLDPTEQSQIDSLEKKLSYEDIRFYRSIARSKLKKDMALRKRLEEEKKMQAQNQSWSSWLWGSASSESTPEETGFGGTMTDEQRKQLYDILDYDEKSALVEALQVPRDSLKTRIIAKLNRGSFALKTDPHGEAKEVMSIVFDIFRASFIQRPDNFETSISLNGLRVFDGTTKDTLYSQIVHVRSEHEEVTVSDASLEVDGSDPFFFLRFENKPLDERADSALTLRMRHMEIIYHKGYVEAVYKFFKPPASQLESVEALLTAASETLEGLRKETRAGLEYALQTHKTIDIQMDMNAPVIIIPEYLTTNQCRHLVIDAGHIAIESDLVAKDAIRLIHQKRHQQYTEDDYKNLESLMYDKLSLRLEDAQFIIGDNLNACRAALTSQTRDDLHLLERISINLRIDKSIVPTAVSLAQFKVSGNLPSLLVNISDSKYKALMRLIDVCIPHFDDGPTQPSIQPGPKRPGFQLAPLFGPVEREYNVDDDDDDDGIQAADEFFEAEDGTVDNPANRQHTFEVDFKVDKLRATVSKSSSEGTEKRLGHLQLDGFSLTFALAKYDMDVDITLHSVSMNLKQAKEDDDLKFVSTSEMDEKDIQLLKIHYHRVQKDAPDFMTTHQSIDQNVVISMSTLVFRAAPEPVLALYDFIMSTFVNSPAGAPQPSVTDIGNDSSLTSSPSEDVIRVAIKLEGVQIALINDAVILSTLSLSTADVTIFVRPKTLRVLGRLGSLDLINQNNSDVILPEFNKLLSIEGKNFADFSYETFDPEKEQYDGIASAIHLNAASIKIHFVEQPLRDLYLFVSKLAKLKGLYDAATQVAVQRASEMDKMRFQVSIKTPIVIFPSHPTFSDDVLVLRLGQIDAQNFPELTATRTSATLHGIQLVSRLHQKGAEAILQMVDEIDISTDIIQTTGIEREYDKDFPDTQISVKVSDVKLHLTQVQYERLVQLSREIPRIFTVPPESQLAAQDNATQQLISSNVLSGPSVDLQPELRSTSSSNWTTLDLVVTINTVKLHLYDAQAFSEDELKEHGIARFALNDNSLRFKQLSDGSGEAQIVLRSFTMSTQPGRSKFREIIPAAQHDRNQFMVLYTMTAGPSPASLAVLTVDSPHIIFAVDPVISLLDFFMSPFATDQIQQDTTSTISQSAQNTGAVSPASPTDSGAMDFRLDLHDVSICILEDDANAESRAIRLHVSQILLSQQGILALTVANLGMSLMKMGHADESVRFLDDMDFTFTLDSRSSSSHQMTNIEIISKAIVFRASYRDINLITSIVNKAIERYSETQNRQVPANRSERKSFSPVDTSATDNTPRHLSVGKARVVISKEQLKSSFDGFRLILIGDMHEQPMLHLKVKPFNIDAKNWTGELSATATMSLVITYWNLTNSHWEPLIDPWTFTTSVAKEVATDGFDLSLRARERLDINFSTTFIEAALTTVNAWNTNGIRVLQTARGSYAPYRIINKTGSSIFVWTDVDTSSNSRDIEAVKIIHDQSIDWRFDDWKTMREHVSSGQHNIGIQFAEKSWEQLRGIPVEREGEFIYSLRPRTEKYPNRLLCEVKVVDNTKIVTIRSTYKVENLTLYPLELMIVDDTGHPLYPLQKILPGNDYSLPIEAVTRNKIRIQPDQGFGYKWSTPIRWEDLIVRRSFTIKCPHSDPREAAFRLQSWVQTDTLPDGQPRKYPKINLKLRAPLELENLLPYNLEYRIYDKNTDQNWRSYLRKGGVMPVHSVELGHFILLNVQIQDTVFKPSEFGIINTDGHSDFDIEHNLTLRDQLDRKLDLKLNYVRHADSGGAFKVQICSPYIIVNKTGLPFSVRATRSTRAGSQDVAGDNRKDALASSAPYLLSHSHNQGHEFIFRFNESSWSKLVSFEAPAADMELITSTHAQRTENIHVGLSWSEGLGKYKLSKVITLMPRFLVKNELTETIAFREHCVGPRQDSTIAPGQRTPFMLLKSEDQKLLTIAYTGLNAQWSPPVNIEDIGTVYFRLNRAAGSQSPFDLVKADIQIEAATIFVFLRPALGQWPFRIENNSDYPLVFCQQDGDKEQPSKDKTASMYSVSPHSLRDYAWDYPAARDKRILLSIADARRVVDIMEIGDLIPFKFNAQGRTKAVSLDVRADGDQQILRITNYNAEYSRYKPRHRSSTATSLVRQDTMSSSTEAFEAVTKEVSPSLSILVDLAGVGISLINRRLVEVVYLTAGGIKFEYTNSTVAQSITFSCSSLQLDNQLHEALFPVILQPTPIPKESSGIGALPTVQASIIWLKDQEHGVLFIKYCSILLQALTIEADEDLLFALYDLTQIQGASWETGLTDVLIQNPDEIHEPDFSVVGQHLYFEVLELQPIKLSLSFMRTERVNSEEKLSIRNPLAVVVNALTMTVGNINDAPLEMNALAIKDMRLTMPELQTRITYHYRQDVLRQLYRILGSADFIGNPVGLFTNVSSGVADIFYEPFQGVVMRGNKELGIGIAKGAASFVKKTVFGVSDSVTKFTSSVGKGLSAATFDSEYQARRRMTQRRNKPRHAIYGVTAGGEALASSVTSAMEGVFMKPIEGAESEGAIGFLKGVGKGIRNTTTVFDNPERDRVRMPRLVPADGVLRPYSAREALGQSWMKDLNNGAYRQEFYVAHISKIHHTIASMDMLLNVLLKDSPGADNVILLTASKVLSFWSRKLRLDWELPFTQIQGVTVEDTGIRFAHKSGKQNDRFAFIPDKASQSWFFNQVATVVKSFNARRRMDS